MSLTPRLLLVSAKKDRNAPGRGGGLAAFPPVEALAQSSSNQAVAYSDRAAFIAAAPS